MSKLRGREEVETLPLFIEEVMRLIDIKNLSRKPMALSQRLVASIRINGLREIPLCETIDGYVFVLEGEDIISAVEFLHSQNEPCFHKGSVLEKGTIPFKLKGDAE